MIYRHLIVDNTTAKGLLNGVLELSFNVITAEQYQEIILSK